MRSSISAQEIELHVKSVGFQTVVTIYLMVDLNIDVPIFISLFLQSPMGGQPALLFNSSSKCSKGKLGPRKYCLYSGKSLKKHIPSSTNTCV